ncbi:MAG: PLDc N-terminal domain-containing protein [Deltaproteobacteria bacterium]|nr:PLDc N-terminal domain-containing protein [Deltaproteobacteria bacterium]
MASTIIGLLILVADIWAILNVIGSATTTGKKVLWIVIILIFPVVGLIVWFFAGPKKG